MRSSRLLLPFSALALLLGSCARHETAVESGNRDQVLHLGNRDEPADLDPHPNTSGTTGILLSSLFEGLVTRANDGVTIHGDSVVANGYASHGCIGVPTPFAKKLFGAAHVGDRVYITSGRQVGIGDSLVDR